MLSLHLASPAPTDSPPERVLADAVAELQRRTRFPVAFGGLEHDNAVHVTSVVGARTRNIDGLVVESGRGLGGKALVEKRPRLTVDYRSARTITHDYDRAILGEGLSTLFAVPVVVGAHARGVIYCGSWAQAPVDNAVAAPAFAVASELSAELRVRDEVDRRLSVARRSVEPAEMPPTAREELRTAYAELRTLAATIDDAALRAQVARVQERLVALTRDSTATGAPSVRLSPREHDVLACVALGMTNAETAEHLALRAGTVKSYLQAAMTKLEASTRHAAVTAARRAGILP